jgi:SAM-dependent methyltransferase
MAGLGRNPDNLWRGSVMEPESFRRKPPPQGAFDAVISVGVLPHIPEEAEESVLANLRDALRPGGLVVVEARNELFSLFTLNRYSHQFFLDRLVDADGLRREAGELGEELENCLAELAGMFRTDLPPLRKGDEGGPGYDEVLSRLHNPLTLPASLARAGFTRLRPLFYHYHCLPPMFESRLPGLFRQRSVALEDPGDWRGHFMASAFMVAGVRA